ncbi:LuxR C-terminal-related transcriptional regulator [Kitasatospora sp. NBC_01539]|uniref:helix-turn-helix transcriptional regulator n=1 Tax=Kitasatospora sp. NBC_01539 TaxID=2903577 RepID=UPI00386032C0
MLEALGLQPSTETVYRLVLDEPTWGVGQLAAHLSWTEEAVRGALDELADLRLLRPGRENPPQLRPVRPELALSALLSRSETELLRQQRQIEATRAAVAEFAARYAPRREYVADLVERHEGLEAVRRRLEELAQSACRECLSFLPGGAQSPDTMDASKPLDQQALERGVVLRSIYQDSFRNDPSTMQYVQWLAGLGGETRTVPSLPMLMVVVDREAALIPLDPADGRAGALEMRSPGAVAAMTALFEQFWSIGVPWGRTMPRNDRGLSPQEQELLRLLAAGNTDEIASRRLGVSLRTVRRMASDLMARLGARSRFEAGVRAARQGWL